MSHSPDRKRLIYFVKTLRLAIINPAFYCHDNFLLPWSVYQLTLLHFARSFPSFWVRPLTLISCITTSSHRFLGRPGGLVPGTDVSWHLLSTYPIHKMAIPSQTPLVELISCLKDASDKRLLRNKLHLYIWTIILSTSSLGISLIYVNKKLNLILLNLFILTGV